MAGAVAVGGDGGPCRTIRASSGYFRCRGARAAGSFLFAPIIRPGRQAASTDRTGPLCSQLPSVVDALGLLCAIRLGCRPTCQQFLRTWALSFPCRSLSSLLRLRSLPLRVFGGVERSGEPLLLQTSARALRVPACRFSGRTPMGIVPRWNRRDRSWTSTPLAPRNRRSGSPPVRRGSARPAPGRSAQRGTSHEPPKVSAKAAATTPARRLAASVSHGFAAGSPITRHVPSHRTALGCAPCSPISRGARNPLPWGLDDIGAQDRGDDRLPTGVSRRADRRSPGVPFRTFSVRGSTIALEGRPDG